jgi:hypothetical protein
MKRILMMLAASASRLRRARPRALRSRGAFTLLGILGLLAIGTSPALSATESTAAAEAKAIRAAQLVAARAQRAADRESRIAKRDAELQQRRSRVALERSERAARVRTQRQQTGGLRHTHNGFVEIGCAVIDWHFENFSGDEHTKHTVTEIVSIDGARTEYRFTFEGPSGSNETPVGASASEHLIDALARWADNGAFGNWDIAAHRVCGGGGPGHSYTIEKRQKIGSEGYVTTPLHGEVGQTIEYLIVVTNTGSEFLDLSKFTDPRCDANTIKGPKELLLAPETAARYTCTHVITPADAEAGSYLNSAEITATPFGHEEPLTTPSNTVEVTIVPVGTKSKEKEKPGEKEKEVETKTTTGNGNGNGNGSSSSTGNTAVLATQEAKGGSLAVIASVPSLNGTVRGCVRSSFVVSVRSKGVRAVTFYLDNHKLKKLTSRSAHAGKLSVRIQAARLKVGVHHIKARIQMNSLTASAKAVIATRGLTFARCASAVISPRFTG